MNKELHYLIQYLSVTNKVPFCVVTDFLKEKDLLPPLQKNPKLLRISAAKEGIKIEQNSDHVLKQLDLLLQEFIAEDIQKAKGMLFTTLINSNFKKKKEEFDKVETSIYKCLNAYVLNLCRVLEVYYCSGFYLQKEPELFIEYGKKMHESIIYNVFNKEERDVIAEQLNLLLGVYLSMYSKFMYQ